MSKFTECLDKLDAYLVEPNAYLRKYHVAIKNSVGRTISEVIRDGDEMVVKFEDGTFVCLGVTDATKKKAAELTEDVSSMRYRCGNEMDYIMALRFGLFDKKNVEILKERDEYWNGVHDRLFGNEETRQSAAGS